MESGADVTSVATQTEHLEAVPSVDVRKAGPADAAALASLCREVFPDKVLWQGRPGVAGKWWNGVLSSGSSETWVWEVDGELAAFSLLVLDGEAWLRQREVREGRFERMATLLLHPRLILPKLRQRIRYAVAAFRDYVRFPGIMAQPGEQVWAELGAVGLRYRKLALGLRIVLFNESRARELHCVQIAGVQDPRNDIWLQLHERLGYVSLGATFSRGIIQTKFLKAPPKRVGNG